jgi:aldehyde dehydrogenase (NAD+)
MTGLAKQVSDFLNSGPLQLFIGGKWVDAAGGGRIDVRDPGTGKVVVQVAAADRADVERAGEAARAAFNKSGWATLPANDRAVILHRLADLIEKNLEVLAQLESLDVGKPLAQATAFDIPEGAAVLRYYADLSVHVRRREPIAVSGYEAYTLRVPYGVCAFVLPWNFPFVLLAWGVAPALAAGNVVIVKPSEETPLSTLYFCRLAQEAGIPDGVVNVIPGYGHTAGAALAAYPGINRMGFTGSPEVGRLIAAACGANLVPVKLELGGKGAAVLFEDIDPEKTADALVAALSLNTGQVCCTATRWIIHESIWDPLVERARQGLERLRIGHSLAPDTEMGPVVSPTQKQRILGYVERGATQGATLLLEGGEAQVPEHPEGFYVKPALLTGPPENVCAQEEIFGPVAYLMPFKTEAQAVDLVNQCPYGLANSVWSGDLERARRVAEAMVAGNSWINAHNVFKHGVPYGGCKLSGMGGGVLSPETFFDYLRGQSIVRPTA